MSSAINNGFSEKAIYGMHFLEPLFTKQNFMTQEIINYPFDSELDNDMEPADRFEQTPEEVFIDRPDTGNTGITYVNGHNLPDDDEDEDEEDDLILGDEDELDEADLAEDEIDVEIEENIDEDVSDADLVLDADEDDEEDDL